MTKQFKPDNEVLSRIAEAFQKHGSVNKTRLHLASRIRWSSFDRYLQWMLDNDLVRVELESSGNRYLLTPAGIEMFEAVLKLRRFVQPADFVL